jgi:hypothetical protein
MKASPRGARGACQYAWQASPINSQIAFTLMRQAGARIAQVEIAGVNLVEQRDVEIGADRQAEADLTEIAALLLIMLALRKFGRGAGMDVAEEN